MKKATIQLLGDDGTYEKIEVDVNEDGTVDIPDEVAAKGATLACWLGIHAYANGVCLNCGKKR